MGCRQWVLVVVLGVVASGCGGDAPVGSSSAPGGGATGVASSAQSAADVASTAEKGTPESAVTVQIVDRPAFDRVLAAYHGKAVLVDFWATWCPPCVKQFPHTVELARRYTDQGLAVVSVSIDDPDEIERVREFLVARKATFDNLLADAGSSDATANAFDLDAGVPQYRVFDRSGQLVRSFSVDPDAEKQFTPDDIEEAVKKALGAGLQTSSQHGP